MVMYPELPDSIGVPVKLPVLRLLMNSYIIQLVNIKILSEINGNKKHLFNFQNL